MKTIQTILLVTVFGIGSAFAQPPGHGDDRGWNKDHHKRFNPERLAEKLDLTAEQTTALKDAQYALEEKMIDLKANHQKAKLALRGQMDADTVDRDALMSAVEAESAAQLAIKKTMIDHKLEMKEILGPEKVAELEAMKKSRMEKRGDNRGPRGGDDESDESDDDSDRRGKRRK